MELLNTISNGIVSMLTTVGLLGGLGLLGAWFVTRNDQCNPQGLNACACGCGTDCDG